MSFGEWFRLSQRNSSLKVKSIYIKKLNKTNFYINNTNNERKKKYNGCSMINISFFFYRVLLVLFIFIYVYYNRN